MNVIPPTEAGIHPVVAVFNSADDVIEMLRVALEGSGFAVVSAKLSEIQSGVMDLVAFVREHRPVAIVYDLPRPYEANWNVLRLLRETASLSKLGWVLTTLDKSALEAAVGPAPVVQIVLGKPLWPFIKTETRRCGCPPARAGVPDGCSAMTAASRG